MIKTNEKKGITLIALVITIIILLILSAITISQLFGENGLLNKTKQSRQIYTFEQENEKLKLALMEMKTETILKGKELTVDDLKAVLGDKVKIVECDSEGNEKISAITTKIASETQSDGGTVIVGKYVKIIFLDSQNWYVVNLKTGFITWTINGAVANTETGDKGETKDITIEYKGVKLKVGDYVNYQPINQIDSYSKNVDKYNEWTINYENSTKWRVLGLTENGQLELISAAPSISTIHKRDNSYNNRVYELNDICKKMYGNNNNGSVARSLNIEDIEKTMDLNYWDYHNFRSRVSGYKYGEVETINATSYPLIHPLEKGYKINGVEGTELGLSEQYELIDESGVEYGEKEEDVTIETRETYWSEKVTEEYFVNPIYYNLFITRDRRYALASRCVEIHLNKETGLVSCVYATRDVGENAWIDASESRFQS